MLEIVLMAVASLNDREGMKSAQRNWKTFSPFPWLGKILGVVVACSGLGFTHPPHLTVSAPNPATFTTFAEWCFNRNNLPADTQHTVNVLLQKAETQDCYAAQDWLSQQTELLLFRRRISDLRPLASLTNLEELWLYTNHIRDVTPLANLTHLTKLWLYDNQIEDISPLASLTNLTLLSLDDNQIRDPTPLTHLTNLQVLNLQANQIVDIRPLEVLKSLTVLNVKENPIEKERCPLKPRRICHF
ncbi:MAG: leucine-rich repeat domain-containing protein [Cyanobacteria bacterium J055]|nr:MAG: leucine-rich repeat domain-containing protein [Cyanobacteria bacterium J055]